MSLLSTTLPVFQPFQMMADESFFQISSPMVPTTRSLAAFGSATQVPPNDVGRLSYYLKCCVLGCGIAINQVPLELLDYSNASSLPQGLQRRIFRLAFEEFRLEHLLNRTIFVDDERTLLARDASNVFFNVRTPLDMVALGRLGGGSILHLPQGQVMLCTTAWLNEFYVSPFLRFVQRAQEDAAPSSSSTESLEDSSSPATSAAATTTASQCSNEIPVAMATARAGAHVHPFHANILCDRCKCQGIQGARYRCTTCDDYDLCERCYYNGSQRHEHIFERIAYDGALPEFMDGVRQTPAIDCDSGRKRSLDDIYSKKTVGEDSDNQEYIPIVVAVPIPDSPSCCNSPSCKRKRRRTSSSSSINIVSRSTSSGPREDATASFVPGQSVRLTGLAASQMNECLAVVQERVDGRVIVRVEDHARPFSVKPENLIIVENGGTSA